MRGQSVTAGTANQVAIDPTARAATAGSLGPTGCCLCGFVTACCLTRCIRFTDVLVPILVLITDNLLLWPAARSLPGRIK